MSPARSPERQRAPQLPWRLLCGASYGWIHGWGHLTIAPGRLVFEFPRFMRFLGAPRLVMHESDVVTEVSPRLELGYSSGLIVQGDEQAVAVHAAPWTSRRELNAALAAAGFRLDERRDWVSGGAPVARARTPVA
jgi:hypothetical protein